MGDGTGHADEARLKLKKQTLEGEKEKRDSRSLICLIKLKFNQELLHI